MRLGINGRPDQDGGGNATGSCTTGTARRCSRSRVIPVAAVSRCRGPCFRRPCSYSVSAVLLVALVLEPVLGSAWWTIGRVGSLQPSWLYDYRLLTPRWDRWSAIVPTLAAVVRAFKISERIARMRV